MLLVVPKVVSLAPALNIFHPGYGEDFFLKTQDRLTVGFMGVSVSLPSTFSLGSSTDYNSNSLKDALGFILPAAGLTFVTPRGTLPFSSCCEN